jgi:hypothetical protein
MSGYCGTSEQQRLQALAEASADYISATPGACQTGRMMGCDNPEALGWDAIDSFLDRDGICGFRMISAETAERLKSRMSKRGYRFDSWQVFVADRDTALAASDAIVSRGKPHGLADLKMSTESKGEVTARIQALMGACGVVPFSGSMLAGAVCPATTVAIEDEVGLIVAAAHGYMPHNTYSLYQHYAWGGLVAVAESQRGRGLGNHINARLVVSVFRDLGAEHIYELVSATNVASRRMVESCGLRRDAGLVCGIVTATENARFTR